MITLAINKTPLIILQGLKLVWLLTNTLLVNSYNWTLFHKYNISMLPLFYFKSMHFCQSYAFSNYFLLCTYCFLIIYKPKYVSLARHGSQDMTLPTQQQTS
jgi:hypothetical protein